MKTAVRAFKRAWAPIDKALDLAEVEAVKFDAGEWSRAECADIRQKEFYRVLSLVGDRFRLAPEALLRELEHDAHHACNMHIEAKTK